MDTADFGAVCLNPLGPAVAASPGGLPHASVWPRCLDVPPLWLPRRKLLLQGLVSTSVSGTNGVKNGAFCGITDMSVSPTFFFPYKAVGGPLAAAELPGAPEGQGHGMPLGVIQGSLS